MPLTPFHLGPALCFGLPLREHMHAPTFFLANIIVDIEPFIVLVFGLNYPLHGYLHTFLFASILGLALGCIMFFMRGIFQGFFKIFLLEGERMANIKDFIVAGISGTVLHVLLDSPLNNNTKPLYPLMFNPFYKPALMLEIHSFCIWTGLLGMAFYVHLVYRRSFVKNSVS
ncbi:MAG: hydrolase [Candidatus Bathyarchaeia archaeon]